MTSRSGQRRGEIEGTFNKLNIQSGVWRRAVGYIRTIVGNKLEKLDLLGYVQTVEFTAYHDVARKVILFQAPKRECRGVLANIRGGATGIDWRSSNPASRRV